MTLDFRILGPVEVHVDGHPLAIGGIRPRTLLAVLVSHYNRVASVAVIASAVWADEPRANLENSVQVAVSALRRALAVSGHGAAIQTVGGGYRLAIEDRESDLGRFLLDCSAARAAAAAGRTGEAAELYRASLAHWSGPALQDLRGSRFADEVGASLEEQRLTTIETRIEVELALGRHRDLVPELTDMIAAHPLREGFWAQLMLALYRCGRQSEALSAYRTVSTRLADELGVMPGPALRAMEDAVLKHSVELDYQTGAVRLADTIREGSSAPGAQLRNNNAIVRIPGSGLRIGRGRDNELVLDDQRVSRYHAAITWTIAGYRLSDLHSTNGTAVNGDRISQHLLADHDNLVIGGTSYEFVLDE